MSVSSMFLTPCVWAPLCNPANLFEILFWYAILVHLYSRLTEKFPVTITVGASIVHSQCNGFVEFRG